MSEVEQITLSTEDVIGLLTGARAGAEHLARFGNDTTQLADAILRVEGEVAERVGAGIPGLAPEHVLASAGRILAVLRSLTPGTTRLPGSATAEQLAEECGLDAKAVELALAHLLADGEVASTEQGAATVWSLA